MADVIYLRKSRLDAEAESRGAGDTLARHEAALLRLAGQLGRNVTEIYREVVSGDTIAARPVMQRLLSEVEQGAWDAVLVMEIERLARGDTIDQGIVAQAFKYSSTKIITPAKTYDPNNEYDEEYFEFALFMSRREYKTINRRQQQGREASVREGKWPANKAPYGYNRVKLEKQKGWTLEEDPATAPTVRLIFDWCAYGIETEGGGRQRLGVARIVRRLNELGIPSPSGQAWTNASVRSIIDNVVYSGLVKWRGRPQVKRVEDGVVVLTRPRAVEGQMLTFPGLHPALISKDAYDRAQQMRKSDRNYPGPKVTGGIKNPLAGLLKCGVCGRAMARRPYPNDMDMYLCPYTSCGIVGSKVLAVDELIVPAMRRWVGDYKAGIETQAPSGVGISALAESVSLAEAELAALEKQRQRAYELVEQGVYTPDEFKERMRALTDRLDEAAKKSNGLKNELAKQQQLITAHEQIIPQMLAVIDAYPAAKTPEDKNRLLKSVLEKIVYEKSERVGRNGTGGDLQLTIYPKLPELF